MTSFFSKLIFDQDLVKQLKEEKLDNGFLYNQLITGKITLKEYLAAI